jgi:hypothetical protein
MRLVMVGLGDHVTRAPKSGARVIVSVLRRFLLRATALMQCHQYAIART